MKKTLAISLAVLAVAIGFFVGWLNDEVILDTIPAPTFVIEQPAPKFQEEFTIDSVVVDKNNPKMGGHVGAPALGADPLAGEESVFAEVVNGTVLRVIVADQAFIDGGYVGDPANWVRTSTKGTIRKNGAGIGFTYDKDRDAFIPPKPDGATIFDEVKAQWKQPIVISSFSTTTP